MCVVWLASVHAVSVCLLSCGRVEVAQTLRVCCEALCVLTAGRWRLRKSPWDPQRSWSKLGGTEPDLQDGCSTGRRNSACVHTKTLAPALCPSGPARSPEPLLSSAAFVAHFLALAFTIRNLPCLHSMSAWELAILALVQAHLT